jgi:hypothetical protein
VSQYEWFGFLIVMMFAFVVTMGPVSSKFPKLLSSIIALGFLFRIIGSLIRYVILYKYYDGGDAGQYYRYGYQYANFIWDLDFSFLDRSHWVANKLWGTQTMMYFSSFVISLIGPTRRGEFLFFSTASFIALLLFIKSFQTNYFQSDLKKYTLIVLLWPSLWFWPSSVGKDAVILFATGLVVYGYTSGINRIRWLALIAGIGLAGIIRPHVAGVMIVSMAIAHWISPTRKWTTFHTVQGLLILILLFVVLRQGFSQLGIEEIDVENLKSYVDSVSVQTSQGGSAIQAAGFSLLGIPLAFVNILFRPFPWEAGSPVTAAASLEMIVFWVLVISRRKRIFLLMKEWRYTTLLRLAVPLTILYILMLGMAVGNLGIIARQRIHILPLLFIWLEAQPHLVTRKQPVPQVPKIRATLPKPMREIGTSPG